MTDEVLVYTSPTCGWAVRTYAALYEKGVAFRAIDVKNSAEAKAEFLRDFPYGLTPGVRHGKTSVWESLLINDYIEEAFPAPPLLPAAAAERARARQWLHHCDDVLFPALYKVLRAQEEPAALQRKLDQLSAPAFLNRTPAPYWAGASIGLVDFAYHVLFKSLRAPGLEKIAIPEWMSTWSDTIAAAPSVARAEAFMASLRSPSAA